MKQYLFLFFAAISIGADNSLDVTQTGATTCSVEKRIAADTNHTIQDIVKEMNIDSVRAAIQVMQNFETRKSTTLELTEKVAPWIYNKLKAYCDSVYYETFLPVGCKNSSALYFSLYNISFTSVRLTAK